MKRQMIKIILLALIAFAISAGQVALKLWQRVKSQREMIDLLKEENDLQQQLIEKLRQAP